MTGKPFCSETYFEALFMSDDEIALNLRENVEYLKNNCDRMSCDDIRVIGREMEAFRRARNDKR